MIAQNSHRSYMAPMAISSLLTFSLFYVMVLMTKAPDFVLEEIKPANFEWFAVRPPTPTEKRPPIVDKALPEETPDMPIPRPDGPTHPGNTGVVEVFNPPVGPVGPASGMDSGPMPMVSVTPQYPVNLLRAGIEGEVLLEFTINTAGGVEDIRVVQSLPQGAFDKAAMRALGKFRFQPMMIDGTPQATTNVKRNFIFKLPEAVEQ